MKKTINILGALAIAAALTTGFTACTNEDLIVNEQQQPAAEAPVYHVSIPASMGVGAETRAVTFGETTATSTFATSDSVFVYNVTKNAWAHEVGNANTTKFLHLQPTALADGGKSCTLSGDLTFCSYTPGHYVNSDYVQPVWTSVAVDATDTYKLYYKAITGNGMSFYYDCQNGTQNEDHPAGHDDSDYSVSHYDFALAEGVTMTLSGTNTLTLDDHVRFTNYGSMFRQRLSFSKAGSSMSPASAGLRYLILTTEHNIFIDRDRLFDRSTGGRTVTTNKEMGIIGHPSLMDANGDVYFTLAFDNTELKSGDKLTFTAEDYNGNLYTGQKSLPASGLQNGKYYYGTLEMVWQSQRAVPTVTASDASSVLPDLDGCFVIGNGATISGSSEGFYCYSTEEGTVTLTGDGTATNDNGYPFLVGTENLTVNLASDYTINTNAGDAISSWKNLYLMTTGGSHTLTVTTIDSNDCGLWCNNYKPSSNGHETTTALDVTSMLAAPGYTVTRSARTDNGDGTYTWTYTVAPTPFTAAAVGKVIGNNGVIYDDVAAAKAASTTAEAMIAYVGAQPGICANGLAISLMDVYSYNATFAEATGDVIIPSWQTYHAIAGGSWRLPSFKDWQYMLWGYYVDTPATTDISGFNTELTTAGGTALASGSGAYFWTSTSVDENNAKLLYYDGSQWSSFSDSPKTGTWHVRACFAF